MEEYLFFLPTLLYSLLCSSKDKDASNGTLIGQPHLLHEVRETPELSLHAQLNSLHLDENMVATTEKLAVCAAKEYYL